MKVLLIQPFAQNEPRTPISLMDLAVYGRECGHEIDVAYADSPITQDYDMVGLSSVSFTPDTEAALSDLRQRHSGQLIFGGKGAETLLDDDRARLEKSGVQIFRGPGEKLFNGGMSIDYDTYPAWDATDFWALDNLGIMWEAMASRGCPFRCHFCHNTEPQVRFFSAERTVQNATLILETIGRPRVFFVDDVFASRAERMYALLKTADASGLELRGRTHFFVHISLLDYDRMGAINAFQPAELQVGIESGDDGMLQAMGKTFTVALAQERLRFLHSHGHSVACLFMLGFPGETCQSLRNTVEFVERNREYMSGWWVSYYQPVPFTKGWDMARERGGEVAGGWNTQISYLDPNLTKKDLVAARQAIMQ